MTLYSIRQPLCSSTCSGLPLQLHHHLSVRSGVNPAFRVRHRTRVIQLQLSKSHRERRFITAGLVSFEFAFQHSQDNAAFPSQLRTFSRRSALGPPLPILFPTVSNSDVL